MKGEANGKMLWIEKKEKAEKNIYYRSAVEYLRPEKNNKRKKTKKS